MVNGKDHVPIFSPNNIAIFNLKSFEILGPLLDHLLSGRGNSGGANGNGGGGNNPPANNPPR
jgi:hypothetical protein